MYMASPPWIWSPKLELSQSSLAVSTLSFASCSFNEARRRKSHRAHRLVSRSASSIEDSPSCSSSSSVEHRKKANSVVVGATEERGKGLSSPIREADDARLVEESRRRRERRRPLWKRIFFASKKVRSIILLNILTVIYASDIPVVKEVELIMDPALFTVVRFAVAAIPFLPFVLKARGDFQTRSAGVELGVWISLAYLSQTIGLLTAEAGRASFISAFTIIVVPLIDGIFGAKIPALTWSGALLSLVGVAILECDGSPPCVGDILNLLSAVFFGIHMLRTEQISRCTKKEKFLALLGYEVCIVALSSFLWFMSKDMFNDVHWLSFEFGSWTSLLSWDWMISFPWIPALYTGVLSTGLCLWVEMSAMRDVSATEAAIVFGLEPVWGAAFAWFLLDERWGTAEWIGAALVLCGSLTVQILGSPPETSSKQDKDSSICNPSKAASNNQSDLSLSTIVIDSRKNPADLFRKREKL